MSFDQVRGIAAPARRALEAHGVKTVADLGRFTEAEVAGWHGIGPTALEALKGLAEKEMQPWPKRSS